MTMAPPFLLDANIFIEAAQRYYAFDLVPTFWQALIDLAESGQLLSIDRVKDELTNTDDDLARWAKQEFASVADGWLVAYAKAHECTVVTHEQSHKDSKRRIYIPDVCQAFSVKYTDPYAMLRSLGIRLS